MADFFSKKQYATIAEKLAMKLLKERCLEYSILFNVLQLAIDRDRNLNCVS